MSTQEHDLALRIDRLERQNRRLRILGVAALGLTGAALLSSAAAVCKTVWAERFVLRDPSNRERAVLTAYETGGAPQLSLLDEQGKAALTFGVNDQGVAYLEVPGDTGPVRRTMGLTPEGQPTLKCEPDKAACTKSEDEVAAVR
jgi:hypothetical protein